MPTELVDALAGLNVAEAVFLAAGLFGVSLVPFFALVDFEPRAALCQLVESGRLDPLLIAIPAAKHAVRDVVLDTAALLILLTTSPKGAMS
jgi:hypothetical protein